MKQLRRKFFVTFISLMLFVVYDTKCQIVVSDPSNLAQSIVNAANEMQYTASSAQTALENLEKTKQIFSSQREFFEQFRVVSAAVKGARKLQEVMLLSERVLDTYLLSYRTIAASKYISPKELGAVASSYATILRRTAAVLLDVREAIQEGGLRLNDSGRMDLILRCYQEAEELISITDYFSRELLSLIRLRDEARRLRNRFREIGGDTKKLNFK
ncbi:MAG: DUF4141 domain-containing protein [Alistipes sp.]|nr:DUF4141 domain-containing protein [Candidatus Alistipes equi]